jgi:hypothetical protein
VREALAPHRPPGTTFATAQSNDPGRYVALIVTERGDCHAVAKLATDPAGRRALEREATALRTLGPALPPPLSAPRVLAQEDGLLVLEAVSWVPRRRPWFLPTDVAHALGRFFRAGAKDGGDRAGATHGDFAPWNLLRTEQRWMLVDWEEARDDGSPFYDLFHHLLISHVNLELPTQGVLLDGIEGRGWVGQAIAAYATGARLDAENVRDHFVSHLVSTRESLDVETPAGRENLPGVQRLLDSLHR